MLPLLRRAMALGRSWTAASGGGGFLRDGMFGGTPKDIVAWRHRDVTAADLFTSRTAEVTHGLAWAWTGVAASERARALGIKLSLLCVRPGSVVSGEQAKAEAVRRVRSGEAGSSVWFKHMRKVSAVHSAHWL